MTHLGDRVTDLVDGQLPPEATETAHAHLAGCMPCREAVEAERLMKARLRSLGAPAPSGDLVARLLAVGGAAPVDGGPDDATDATRPGRLVRPAGAGVPGRPPASRPAGSRPGGRPAGRPVPRRSRRLTAVVLGALSVVGVGTVGLSLSTGLSPATVLPPVATFVVERTATTRDIPFVTVPATWLGNDGDGSDH